MVTWETLKLQVCQTSRESDTNRDANQPFDTAHDPIFFMHHANVDRVLALWQAINYDTFVTSSTAEEGSFVWPAGSTIDETTRTYFLQVFK